MRALLLTAALALSVSALVACSPAQVGLVGVGVDEAGGPVVVMTSCEGPAVEIRVESAPDGPSEEVQESITELRLENPEPSGDDPAAVSLVEPGPNWRTVESGTGFAAGFEDGRVYYVRAWPDEPSTTLGEVAFTTEDLAQLGDGEVLFYDDGDERLASAAEFTETGLSRYG